MIKYKTSRYGTDLIEAVEIERETSSFVITKNGREAKRTSWNGFFDTMEEAKRFLMELQTKDLEDAKNRLGYQQEKMDDLIKRLKNY